MNSSNYLFQVTIIILIISIQVNSINYNNNKYLMKTVAQELSDDFNILKNEELGIEFIEKLFSTFNYETSIINSELIIEQMAMDLEKKIDVIFNAILDGKNAIENIQKLDNTTKARSSLLPCLSENMYDFNSQVSKMCGTLIGLVLYKPTKGHLNVDFVLQKVKSQLVHLKGLIKQHYFISSYDIETHLKPPFSFCTEKDHTSIWEQYILKNNYNPRKFIIILDHGSDISKNHLNLIKLIGFQILSYLNDNDQVALFALTDEWTSPNMTNECYLPDQIPLTNNFTPNFHFINKTNQKLFKQFIKNLNIGNGPTNHTLGIEQALKIIQQQQQLFNDDKKTLILYISRGLVTINNEISIILRIIADWTEKTKLHFVINSIAVVNELNPFTKDTIFLKDLALQNYGKYNITPSVNLTRQKGELFFINSSYNIGFIVAHIYSKYNLNHSFNLNKSISLPRWNNGINDLTVTFSIGIYNNNQYSLLGIDVYFKHLLENIIYFTNNQYNYVFLMDNKGRVIVHPSYPSFTIIKQQITFVDIEYFEKLNFHLLRKRLLNEKYGTHIHTHNDKKFKYTWYNIKNYYIICMVTRENYTPLRLYNINWPFNSTNNNGNYGEYNNNIQLVYRHLDYNENSKLCRHLNKIATLGELNNFYNNNNNNNNKTDAGSLYLSVSCFKSPNDNINDEKMTNFMVYLQDNTGTYSNPGLKDHIKNEVTALSYILNYLRNQHLSSDKSKFIVRRYVASYSGILEMYPGIILDKNFDPTKRSWFLQAIEHKRKIILTPPYLDEGGAGYIVTIAYATTNFIVAMDLTYGFIYKMLLKRMKYCSTSKNITCFLMDDRGYLIYHPNLINPNGYGPVEKQHIVHKESLVASDILNHKHFIKKLLCNSYGTGAIQRYYKLNTSFTDVLVNVVQGENCVAYHIVTLTNLNIFFGMVNATCNIVATFCPCSIVDRLCLNCNRMEQKECECPCECPLEPDKCLDINLNNNNNPICNWFPEHNSIINNFQEDPIPSNKMKSCFPLTCTMETTYIGCFGVAGCEWCKFDVDGSLLNEPFCASLSTCFNGVLGSISPYKPYDISIPFETNEIPLSFILIIIIGIILLLILAYIYHRSTINNTNERLYLSSTQDNQLRMSELNINDNYHPIMSNNHRDKLLQDDKNDQITSPYSVTTTYHHHHHHHHHHRRTTAPTADSDHGYSTMTQHDESEHLSLAPKDIDSLDDDLSSSDSTSLSLKPCSSFMTNDNSLSFTRLPNKNNCTLVVPVTVHRHMELT